MEVITLLSLTLLSITTNTAIGAQNQLKEIFGNMVDVKSITFESLSVDSKLKDDLVVLTSPTIKDEALGLIDPKTKVIVADRTIDIASVSKLYEIPKGTSVLVVNKLYDTALQAIEQLGGIGINHLKFFPYYPNMGSWNKDCEYAITFGEEQLIPNNKLKVINLGMRTIDITTCITIAAELNIYENVKSILTSVFLRSSLQILYNYSQEYSKNLILTNNLQQLLDIFKSGILLLDRENRISFHNSKAQQQLNIENNSSDYINDILSKSKSAGEDFFIEINEKNYHIEINNSIYEESFGTIITVEDIKDIEKIEKKYRLSLRGRGLTAEYNFKDIIYKSKKMEQLILKAKQFAKSKSTILIEGESGTGKELLAQSIHNASDRAKEAFVAVNFASLSESLSESELFGYEEGAFTGAKKGGKPGLFEMAHKGTIFLDEIGDASINIQKKLLRVIQEHQVLRVGGSQLISIDIRIIAATNQDIQAMVNENKFREDLYYRLNVLPLKIPSLKERTEDVYPLFNYFLKNEFNVNVKQFPENLRIALESYEWSGNIRELRNMAEYIANFIESNMDWEKELSDIMQNKISKTLTIEDTDITDIVTGLEEHCFISTFMQILKILDTSPFKWTRKLILKEMQKSNIKISESQVKRYLLILNEYDLIQSKTGYGTYIRELGRVLLNRYEKGLL